MFSVVVFLNLIHFFHKFYNRCSTGQPKRSTSIYCRKFSLVLLNWTACYVVIGINIYRSLGYFSDDQGSCLKLSFRKCNAFIETSFCDSIWKVFQNLGWTLCSFKHFLGGRGGEEFHGRPIQFLTMIPLSIGVSKNGFEKKGHFLSMTLLHSFPK